MTLDKTKEGMLVSLTMDKREKCLCVTKHVPLPMRLYAVHIGDMEVYLCATAFDNLENLQGEYTKHNGPPPGSIRKHYGEYIQELARRNWAGV